MKTIVSILSLFILTSLFSQQLPEKKIKSEINDVTVFLKGAQIVRKKEASLIKGETLIKFTNLSPFVDGKSIQVKVDKELTVLSVNFQKNYLTDSKDPEELKMLQEQLQLINDKIELEQTHLAIIKEDLTFLAQNRAIGGKNESVSVSHLKEASEFFSNRLKSLKMQEIERSKKLFDLEKEKIDLKNQIGTLSSREAFPTGEILVKVDAKQSEKFQFDLSYFVENAGWYPSYDIRAKNVTEPIQLIYKANIKQDTKVDWSNVKLRFSSANPNVSGVAPELKTYFLDYNTLPPSYGTFKIGSVQGTVQDENGIPLPGATVLVAGTTIGTTTDFDGNYSITVPNNSGQLTFSFIGYETLTLPINSTVINVTLDPSANHLEEVVVTGYGVSKKLQGRGSGVSVKQSNNRVKKLKNTTVPTVQVKNQTSVDFEIKKPYTIKSNNKNYAVEMDAYEIPAYYQYYCIPKIERDAFLIANIVDWEKYSLLEGEANLFFENTYVGKTLMDVRYATDTLQVSLGRDKKVSVKREKIKDFTDKQFIGNKREDFRGWKTIVKNNKNQEINMMVLDQVPVSENEQIEVILQAISGAKHKKETGKIKWEFKLKPQKAKELNLKYSVKYPKQRRIILE